ncbi:MAG: acyltransferase [Candidatus Kuenenia sp.]|nr:acyltransferase [Candidatus Kuenenia hertensis]
MLIGDNVRIYHRAWLVTLKKDDDSPSLIIEDNTVIGHYAVIAAKKNVRIGKKVLIADKVYISDNLHGYEDIATPIMDQPVIYKGKVYIGDNSWIGQNVSIIGASIGKHCVVGANSVVVKDLPDYCVAAGAPATVIKKYNFETNEWQRVD